MSTSGARSRSWISAPSTSEPISRPRVSVHDVALAPLDLLARVIAVNTAAFRGFHALAIDHAGQRAGLSSLQFPGFHDKVMVHRAQQTTVPPVVEIALHRRERWKVVRQHRPLAARRGHIKDPIHYVAQRRYPWPPVRLACWHERRKQRPFPIRHIACIASATALIILASDFSSHVVPPPLLRHKRENHNILKSLN